MFEVKNFPENKAAKVIEELGPFKIVEYQKDLSVSPMAAQEMFFRSEMNVRKKQVVCNIDHSNITLQAGAMQWTVGDVKSVTGVKGVSDFLGKMARSTVTGETVVKPEYTGTGLLTLEPTYKHILLVDLADWNGSIVLDDGLFLACESSLKHKLVTRTNLSSAVAGGKGLFNLSIQGSGILCLESPVPKEELIEIQLTNDTLKVDGNLVIAWSQSLEFTVERSGTSLIGSAASGEGLVNVYRGTGRIWMASLN